MVDAMLYIAHTGCQWRFLPEGFGPWTRVWSQFRRWSRNGTWARALTVLHAAVRGAAGRAEPTLSMVVIDTHLARGASNGGRTFHDRGGPYGRTKGAKRVVAVDVTGLPVAALVVPASTHENGACELVLRHLSDQGAGERLELVLVDRGSPPPAQAASGDVMAWRFAVSVGRSSSRSSVPSGTPGGWRWPTLALAAAVAWRSRSRTPRRPPPAGCMSPASQTSSSTCPGSRRSPHASRLPRRHSRTVRHERGQP